ncbi:ABC transporter ATP-binding protein [Candidatus Uhrbacteria bacterium]|nr:ABC transporter ATP-binding protein [Candidatus Uhrbacteria bacterium]
MAILELHHVSKSFGGVRAVDNCSFEVIAGKITALIGPNGAGKTTVFNLVSGFFEPDRGRILFEGKDVTRLPAWRRSRAGLSRTFQLSRLFRNLSVRENLMLAARYDDDQFWRMVTRPPEERGHETRIRETMRFVGLRKDLDAIVTDLSYGEQKLFDLTRALVNPHTLLILDEPVAGVNPVIRTQLRDLMRAMRGRGETILLIEHDMDFVRSVADHVIVLDQGSVLAEGEPEKILKDRRVLEAYLGTA